MMRNCLKPHTALWFRHLTAAAIAALMLNACMTVSTECLPQITFAVAADVQSQETPSHNLSANDYTVWAAPVKSHLYEIGDNRLERVEYVGDHILLEHYTADTQTLLDSRTLELPLPLYGGCFHGSKYNFIVCGLENTEDDPDAEVIRLLKYSMDWELLDESSVCDINTHTPFSAGSMRMIEYNGKLVVYTSHTMYARSEEWDIHHQSNLPLVFDQESMKLEQTFYNFSLISDTGYVSHSFNQFIQTDGTYIYRVDHGDAHPRAISITRCSCSGKITDVSYCLTQTIPGYAGDNYTNASIGGLSCPHPAA